MISDEAGQYLVDIAKKAIEHYIETKEKMEIPKDYPEELDEKLGVFVTLNKTITTSCFTASKRKTT